MLQHYQIDPKYKINFQNQIFKSLFSLFSKSVVGFRDFAKINFKRINQILKLAFNFLK